MSQKRNPDDFGNSSPDDNRRKSLTSSQSVVQEVMRQNKFKDIPEPMLRKIIKEEVESAIKKHVISIKRNCEDVLPSESRSLKLKFLSTLCLPLFTGTRIKGEDGSAIKVALVDAPTDNVVQYAPESSAKIEIVVLDGDFDGDDGDNWTLEEFKNKIVRERAGKRPILTGDVYMYLKEGIGSIGEIFFLIKDPLVKFLSLIILAGQGAVDSGLEQERSETMMELGYEKQRQNPSL